MKTDFAPQQQGETTSNTSGRVPLISVITITYNAASTIKPTLASIASQRMLDFEHIVIDGASTDGTARLVSELSPESILLSEPDKGLYDAMNKGLRMACGEYVLFMNAGDSFHGPDTLQAYADAIGEYSRCHRSAAHFCEVPRPDIIYGDTVIVNAAREVLGPRHLSVPDRLTFRSFAKGMLVCHQSFMVRRAITEPYDLRYRFSADYEWTLRCLKRADPRRNINLHRVVTDYLSDGLTDRNHMASLKERFRIMSRYYGTLPTIANHFAFLLRALRR